MGCPKISRLDVVAQDIGNIEENTSLDVAYDRERWKGLAIAAMDLDGPTS